MNNLIKSIVKFKVKRYYSEKRERNKIASWNHFFEIAQMVSYDQGLKINPLINQYFSFLNSVAVNEAIQKTMEFLSEDNSNIFTVDEFIEKKRPTKQCFLEIYNQYYLSNYSVKDIESLIKNFILNFEKIIIESLNIEKMEDLSEKTIDDSNLGDVGFLVESV